MKQERSGGQEEQWWMLVSYLGIAPGVSNKPTLDSGLCVPETKHRATACSGCALEGMQALGAGWAGLRRGCQEECRFHEGRDFSFSSRLDP